MARRLLTRLSLASIPNVVSESAERSLGRAVFTRCQAGGTVKRTWPSSTRAVAVALVSLLVPAFSAAPADSAERPAVSTNAPTRPSLSAAATARLAAAPIPARALVQVAPAIGAPAEDGKSFFKRPAGVAAIVLMAAGTGWMVYSAFHDNDPVHSPFR